MIQIVQETKDNIKYPAFVSRITNKKKYKCMVRDVLLAGCHILETGSERYKYSRLSTKSQLHDTRGCLP